MSRNHAHSKGTLPASPPQPRHRHGSHALSFVRVWERVIDRRSRKRHERDFSDNKNRTKYRYECGTRGPLPMNEWWSLVHDFSSAGFALAFAHYLWHLGGLGLTSFGTVARATHPPYAYHVGHTRPHITARAPQAARAAKKAWQLQLPSPQLASPAAPWLRASRP